MDFNDRQSGVTAIMSSCDLDLNVGPVTGSVGHRFGKSFPAVSFFGRSESQGAMRAGSVIPARKNIKPTLNRHLRSPPAVGGYYSPRLEFLE